MSLLTSLCDLFSIFCLYGETHVSRCWFCFIPLRCNLYGYSRVTACWYLLFFWNYKLKTILYVGIQLLSYWMCCFFLQLPAKQANCCEIQKWQIQIKHSIRKMHGWKTGNKKTKFCNNCLSPCWRILCLFLEGFLPPLWGGKHAAYTSLRLSC